MAKSSPKISKNSSRKIAKKSSKAPSKKVVKKVAKKSSSATANKLNDKEQVIAYMNKLQHPLKDEIEAVREIIKSSNTKISERIKWNAPSYYYKEDFVTFNPRAQEHVHLVFHHIAIASIKSDILKGDYNDRRMVYLSSMEEVKAQKKTLQFIINELIKYMDKL